MRVGFTGTRDGMTREQHREVCRRVQALRPHEVHHGVCVGADAQFHEVAKFFWPVVGHPGPESAWRAVLRGFSALFAAKDYGDRNQDIVDCCDVLVAAPKESREQPSGGTWQTVRRARAAGRRIVIVWPDGTASTEGFE